MSMSYGDQDQAFSSYPQSAMMHDPNQEQEDSISLHHRTQVYPDPGAAMDEMTPYNPQALDPSSGLIDDIPPPQNDDGDPTGRGRSPPIPKPNREVTKGEDGRFVCTWTGCTEDTRAFNRKCEWSKACCIPSFAQTGLHITNQISSTWTSTTGHTNAQQKDAKNSQASRIPAVFCDINEKSIIFTAAHENN